MGRMIAYENGRISDFQGLLTLTSDRVILHAVMHHSSTYTYIPNFIAIEETFVDGRTGGHLKPTLLGRLGRVDLNRNMRKYNKTRNTFCRTWYLPHSRVHKFILNCAHSNRIPYPLFCSCCDVHVLLKNIK